MATVYLMASRPGAYTREGLILGNPEVKADAVSPSGSYPVSPQLVLEPAEKYRLLSIVSDAAIEVLQVAENETTSVHSGVATTIPAPIAGQTSYGCLLHPATVGVYVKTL